MYSCLLSQIESLGRKEGIAFLANEAGKWAICMQKLDLDTDFALYVKINSKGP